MIIDRVFDEVSTEFNIFDRKISDFDAIMRSLINEFMIADDDDQYDALDGMIFNFAYSLGEMIKSPESAMGIQGVIQNAIASI